MNRGLWPFHVTPNTQDITKTHLLCKYLTDTPLGRWWKAVDSLTNWLTHSLTDQQSSDATQKLRNILCPALWLCSTEWLYKHYIVRPKWNIKWLCKIQFLTILWTSMPNHRSAFHEEIGLAHNLSQWLEKVWKVRHDSINNNDYNYNRRIPSYVKQAMVTGW